MDQNVLDPEPKTFRGFSRSEKFWMPGAGAGARNLSFGSTVLVLTTVNLAPGFLSASFLMHMQIGQLKSYGVSTGLVHVKTIAVFIMHVQLLG